MLAESVGKEKFAPDCDPIMQTLLAAQKSGIASDDPAAAGIMTTFARIAKSMGPDFVKYLPQIMPALLKSAGVSARCVLRRAVICIIAHVPSHIGMNFVLCQLLM